MTACLVAASLAAFSIGIDISLFGAGGISAALLQPPPETPAVPTIGRSFAVYATSTACGAIAMSGGASVDSFDSSQGSYAQTRTQDRAVVGVSGNITLSGASVIYGRIFARNINVGSCRNGVPGITLSGGSRATEGYVRLPAAPVFPAPAAATPGTQDYNISNNLTLPPGNYRNIAISGGATLTFSAGTYHVNSLSLSGQSVLALAPPGQVIVNVAGNGVSQPVNLSGGTLQNLSGIPLNFQLIYGGGQSIALSGGTMAYGVIYAPNAGVTLGGGGGWFGAMTVRTLTSSGGSSLHYDRALIVPPTITTIVTPAPNSNGWHNTNVTVSFACSGPLGIASCSAPVTVTTEGRSQVITGTATDNAENTAAASVTLNIDKTAPVVTAAAAPAANGNDWNNTPDVVTFAATDALSGVNPASLTAPATLSADGTNLAATGQATDLAGNVGTVTRPGINIDRIVPTIAATLNPAANANGRNNTPVTAHFTCADAGSGVGACEPDVMLSAEGANQTVSGTVTDLAGNTASVTSAAVNIDVTPPVVAVTSPPNGSVVGVPGVTLAGTVSDALSGVSSVACSGQPATVIRTGGRPDDERARTCVARRPRAKAGWIVFGRVRPDPRSADRKQLRILGVQQEWDAGVETALSRSVDWRRSAVHWKSMELHLSSELEGKLAAAASRRGVSVEVLAREALERAVDYDDWFLREVETGLAQVEDGQTLTHEAVGTRLARKLAGHDDAR